MLVVALLAVAVLTILVIAQTGRASVLRARVDAAADAVALAAAGAGTAEANRVAVLNGVVVDRIVWRADVVVVTVTRAGVSSTAAAQRSITWRPLADRVAGPVSAPPRVGG